MVRRVREEREQRQEEGRLVIDAAVVRGDIVGIEEEAFLYCIAMSECIMKASFDWFPYVS